MRASIPASCGIKIKVAPRPRVPSWGKATTGRSRSSAVGRKDHRARDRAGGELLGRRSVERRDRRHGEPGPSRDQARGDAPPCPQSLHRPPGDCHAGSAVSPRRASGRLKWAARAKTGRAGRSSRRVPPGLLGLPTVRVTPYWGWAGCGAGAGAGCAAGAGVVAGLGAGAVPAAGTALASRVGAL